MILLIPIYIILMLSDEELRIQISRTWSEWTSPSMMKGYFINFSIQQS